MANIRIDTPMKEYLVRYYLWDKAERAFAAQERGSLEKYLSDNRECCLHELFTWSGTAEGHDFWRRVSDTFEAWWVINEPGWKVLLALQKSNKKTPETFNADVSAWL